MQGDMATAIDYHRRAIGARPDAAFGPLPHRGRARISSIASTTALASYDEAIRLKGDYAEAYYNRSFVHLSRGDFARGWPDYEWRFSCKEYKGRQFNAPVWDGTPLAGRTLLIHAEQGLGDTLHFIRYVRLAERLGGQDLRRGAAGTGAAAEGVGLYAASFPAARRCRTSTCTPR